MTSNDGATELSLEEKYPEANEEEAELLGLLDEVIAHSSVNITVPSIREYEMSIDTSFLGFIYAAFFGFPLIAFLINSLAAVWLSYGAPVPESVDPIPDHILRLYPYAVAITSFLFCAIPMQRRISKMSKMISLSAKETPQVVTSTINNVANNVESKVDLVNMRLKRVMDALEPKFVKAKIVEEQLQQMDPTISIPAPNSVGRDIEGAKEEISGSILFVVEALPVKKWIPAHLYSYQWHVTVQRFSFILASQLVCVSAILQYYPIEIVEASDKHHAFHMNLLRNITRIFTSDGIEGDDGTRGLVERFWNLYDETSILVEKAWPSPLVFAIAVFGLSIIQLAVIFNKTTASETCKIVNQMRNSVNSETHQVLRQQGLLFLCKDILGLRMRRVRKEILDMVKLSLKLDMLMDLTDTTPANSTPNTSSPSKSQSGDSPSSMRGSIRNFFKTSP